MDNNKNEKPKDFPEEGMQLEPQANHDPYPKMIIVCFLVTIFFFFLVFFATLLDFANRGEQTEIKPKNPAFFEEHLKTMPYTGSN